MSLLIGLRVANRVRVAVRGVARLADGDLTGKSGVASRDELGQMADGLDRAIARLRGDMVQLAGNANTLQDAAGRLTAVSGSVDAAANDASAQAASVAAAAAVVSNNLQVRRRSRQHRRHDQRRVGGQRRTSDSVGDTRQAASELADTAVQLQTLVSRFRY